MGHCTYVVTAVLTRLLQCMYKNYITTSVTVCSKLVLRKPIALGFMLVVARLG